MKSGELIRKKNQLTGKYKYWYNRLDRDKKIKIIHYYLVDKDSWSVSFSMILELKSINLSKLDKVYKENKPNLDEYRSSKITMILKEEI